MTLLEDARRHRAVNYNSTNIKKTSKKIMLEGSYLSKLAFLYKLWRLPPKEAQNGNIY
jgi:hypothetical protein